MMSASIQVLAAAGQGLGPRALFLRERRLDLIVLNGGEGGTGDFFENPAPAGLDDPRMRAGVIYAMYIGVEIEAMPTSTQPEARPFMKSPSANLTVSGSIAPEMTPVS